MKKLFSLSAGARRTVVILLCCTIAGSAAGWGAAVTAGIAAAGAPAAEQGRDIAFVLPAHPPAVASGEASALDPALLASWEVTAHQPLPPRKEPLTPPGWKIVGVTIAGKERNVLLLFDNQKTTESRKIGDALPGGAKIVQISQDELRLVLNGQLMKLSLHKQ